MKDTFEQFLDMLDKNEKYDVWVKSHSVRSYSQELGKEINELLEGLKNNDQKNIEEEIADILYNAFVLAKIVERDYGFEIKTLMNNIIQKMQRRKPYIFEEKEVTMEESIVLWQEAKRKEKLK